MKNAKKLLSLVLMIFMLVGMLQIPAFAAEKVTIKLVPEKTTVQPGETVKVDIVIENNTLGLSNADFYFESIDGITYKFPSLSSGSEYLMANTSELTHDYVTNTKENKIVFSHNVDGDDCWIYENGKLAYLNIVVAENAPAGQAYTIGFTSKSQATYYNEDWDIIKLNPNFVGATVTVEGEEPEPTPVAVTGVELDKTALEFTLGSETLSDTLTATVLPAEADNKAVAWTTSDATVATVENGVVTAKGEGTAVIAVTTEDGGFTAECTVKVNPVPKTMNGDHADMNVSSELVTAGDAVQMLISVENDQNAASEYNSYEFVVSYDSANLTYTNSECDADENCAVTEKNGKLIVNGYGEIKTVSEDAFVILHFIAGNSGEEAVTANVYLEEAYRDTSEMAINRDIDKIDIETSSKTITIQPTAVEYEVTFTEEVKVNSAPTTTVTVKANETVEFDIIPQDGKDVSVRGDGVEKVDEDTYKVVVTKDTEVTITYTAKTYNVTVDGTGKDDVIAATTATHGVEFTFNVKQIAGYSHKVNAKIGENTLTLSSTNNINYTIAAADVTGDITITVERVEDSGTTPDNPDFYTVTVYKNGEEDSNASATATEGQPYTYTVEDGYKLLKVIVNEVEISPTLNGSELTVPAVSVTGNIEIHLGQIYTVTLPGADTPEDKADDTVNGDTNANYGTDYIFTVQDGYKPTVKIGEGEAYEPVLKDGKYTIAGETITGNIVITTSKIVYAATVDVYGYVKVGDAAVIQLVVATASQDVAEGEILQYNNANMYWSSNYNAYAYLVVVEENEALLTKETAAEKIGAAKANATEIIYNGNVNMTAHDVVDVNDAQLVYDIYKATYNDFNKVNMEKMLRADMNANSANAEATYGLTVEDVTAVVNEARK